LFQMWICMLVLRRTESPDTITNIDARRAVRSPSTVFAWQPVAETPIWCYHHEIHTKLSQRIGTGTATTRSQSLFFKIRTGLLPEARHHGQFAHRSQSALRNPRPADGLHQP